MKYYVIYAIEARYMAEVEADTIEEAKKMAEDEWCGADFGEAFDIAGEQIYIEDNNDIVWEKD